MTRARAARSGRRPAAGSSVLYVIILSPIIMLSLALALDVGALQMQRERFRSAADMATVSAGSSSAVVGQGIGVDPRVADATLRQGIADNLTPLTADIAGMTPQAIALSADVMVITTVPSADPLDPGHTLTRPTIETRFGVPVHSGLLAVAGVPSTITITVVSRADLRVVGGTQR